MYRLLLIASLILLTELVIGSVTISCDNPVYAGKKLDFFGYSDPVTTDKVFVFSLEFDENGKCTKTIENKETTFIFCDFGIYRGMLFLEHGQNVILELPPFREKSFADQKNPYFIPVSFWFTTENKKQLNNQISDFSIKLNQLTDKYFNQLYFRQSKVIFDSVAFTIEMEFGHIASEPFQFHKKLTMKMIDSEIFRLKPENYAEIFSGIKPAFWLRPAFIEILDKTFSGYLSFEAKKIKGDDILSAVNNSNINYLADHINTKFKITGEIAGIVLLKLLHDAFYSGDFSKEAIQEMVNSERFIKSKNELIKTTANNIINKFTHLQQGSLAPAICLKTIEGKNVCSNTNNEKFKFVVFADTEMVVCREHLKYLEVIQQKFEKHLEIFIILRKTNLTEMKKFLNENKVPGIKLIDEDNEFIELYKVKSFPQSFLLNKKHRVQFIATKSPLDGFEQQFRLFLQRELFEQQRNQTR